MMTTVKSVGYSSAGTAMIAGSYVPMGIGQAFLWVGNKFMTVADAMATTGTRWKLYSQALVDVESGKISQADIKEKMLANGGDKQKAVCELYAALHAEDGGGEKASASASAEKSGAASSIFKKVDLSASGSDAAAAAAAAALA